MNTFSTPKQKRLGHLPTNTMIASTQTNHPLANIATRPATVSPLLLSLLDSLHQAGLRVTLPRRAILAGLLQQTAPVSIEQLHASLSPKSCDLVTVYRCLAAFEAIGVVRRSYFNNGTAMYQLVRADRPNYHLINRANGEARPLDTDLTPSNFAKPWTRSNPPWRPGDTGVSPLRSSLWSRGALPLQITAKPSRPHGALVRARPPLF